jgi:hypothetical protein
MTSLINLVDEEEQKTTSKISTEELQLLLEDIAKKVE